MKKLHITLLTCILSTLFVFQINVFAAPSKPTGKEILKKSSKLMNDKNVYAKLNMTLVSKSGHKKIRKMRSYSRSTPKDGSASLVVFDAPSGVSGVALLSKQTSDAQTDQWLYLPALSNKLKRIANSGGGMRNKFLGTDFTYEDMSPIKADDFDVNRQPDKGMNYVIDIYPKSSTLKADSGYKYRKIFVDKKTNRFSQIDFYNKRGKLFKRQYFVQYDNSNFPIKTIMEDLKSKHKTEIKMLKRQVGEKYVPKSYFSKRFITSGKYMRVK